MATEHDQGGPVTAEAARSGSKIRPLNSLVAAAARLKSTSVKRGPGSVSIGKPAAWQEDAWAMYDQVGEERFLATSLSGRGSQARFYVGKLPEDPTDTPEPVEEGVAAEAFASFGGTPAGRAQIVLRLGINLFVAGDGWIVGIPNRLIHPPADSSAPADPDEAIVPTSGDNTLGDLTDLQWRMFSVSEVTASDTDNKVTFDLGAGDKLVTTFDDVFMIRVWRPHPRTWWEADSPTRSSLPVLRELVGLTMHVSAQVDSRLAGAGVFIVPQSAKEAFLRGTESTGEDDDSDPFTEALIEAMLTPISDRSNASALVPLVLTVPDDVADKFTHLRFSTDLDSEAKELRDEAIRRLALGQDAPPEVLLGTSDANHWGAWLLEEQTVTTHIEPNLALICDALTTQYLWPVLIESGMPEDEAHTYVVWYDVSHLIARPNRFSDATLVYDRGELSGAALRDAGGFAETDAPQVTEAATDPAIETALSLVSKAPSLMSAPGLEAIVAQIRRVMAGETEPDPSLTTAGVSAEADAESTTSEDDTPADGGPPDTADDDAPDLVGDGDQPAPSGLPASAGALAFAPADDPVWRQWLTKEGTGAR